ncbi:MAG: DEAD/DEAH box helicase [Proteocatella sp.]
MDFKEFDLSEDILKAIEIVGYKKPTKVQDQVIPEMLICKEVLIFEKTGEGKTASFAIPICEKLDWEINSPQALVVAPTRELAIQIANEMSNIGKYKRLNAQPIYGKQDFDEEKTLLKQKCHVVVATVGRLFDHIERGTIDLSRIKYFVLDEFDELTKTGFIEKVNEIIASLPKERQNVFASATIPENIDKITRNYLDSPFVYDYRGNLGTEQEGSNIEESYICVDTTFDFSNETKKKSDFEKRMAILQAVIFQEKALKIIVFCNTQLLVENIYSELIRDCESLFKIHGDMTQRDRIKALKGFANYGNTILVSTNVTARGIHVDDVDLILNFEMPFESEKYTHRIGRTARAGKSGKAVTIVGISQLNKFLEQNVERKEISEYEIYGIPNKSEFRLCFSKFNLTNSNFIEKQKMDPSVTKLYFGGGKNKKLRATDFVGTLCSIDGVDAEDIGVIKLGLDHTLIDVLNGKGKIVVNGMKEKKVKGKKLKINIARNQ